MAYYHVNKRDLYPITYFSQFKMERALLDVIVANMPIRDVVKLATAAGDKDAFNLLKESTNYDDLVKHYKLSKEYHVGVPFYKVSEGKVTWIRITKVMKKMVEYEILGEGVNLDESRSVPPPPEKFGEGQKKKVKKENIAYTLGDYYQFFHTMEYVERNSFDQRMNHNLYVDKMNTALYNL